MELRSLTAISAFLAVQAFTALFAASISVGRAETYTVPIGREEILFDPGEGYCPLDAAAHAFDRRILNVQRAAVEGYSLVLAIFLPCDQLAAARMSQSGPLRRWATLLATLTDGELRKAQGDTRFSYMDGIEAALGKGVKPDEAAVNKRLEKVAAKFAGDGAPAIRIGAREELGVLAHDVAAVYAGAVLDAVGPNSGGRTAAVTAITLIREYPISYNVYHRFTGPGSVRAALAEAQPVMRQAVMANEVLSARVRERSDFPVATARDHPGRRAISNGILLVGGFVCLAVIFAMYHWFGTKARRVP